MTVPNNANAYLPPTLQIPSALEITAISQANPMVVTVTENSLQTNTYIPGQLVKFMIPFDFGMQQVNGLTLPIQQVLGSNLTFYINSSQFDPFSVVVGETPATLSPSGSQNLQFSNSTTQLAFQSLNDVGN